MGWIRRNVIGGAIAGFLAGGPVGGITGAVANYGVWKIGEVATPQTVEWLEILVNNFK